MKKEIERRMGKGKQKKKGILKERKESVQGKEIVIKKIAKKARRNDNKKGKKISVIYVENSTRETDQADFIKKKKIDGFRVGTKVEME